VRSPYFCLPGNVADSSIAPSCRACFDYTNALADVTVGYMGAPLEGAGGPLGIGGGQRMDEAYQTLTVRNHRGEKLVDAAVAAGRIGVGNEATGSGSHEKISAATVGSDATVMTGVGPKGIGFARYSVDYHILRNYLHVLNEWGEERAGVALPEYARDIVQKYLDREESFRGLRDEILERRNARGRS